MSRFFLPLNTGFGALYLSVFLLSVNGLFARSIELDSTSITQLRSVIAGGAIIALCLLQKRSLLVGPRSLLVVYCLGILLGLHWVTYFQAMQSSSVAVGILALFTHPVFTVLLEPIFQGRRPEGKDLLAALVVAGGITIMVSAQLGGSDQLSAEQIRTGVFWGVGSALLFAFRNTAQKYWLHHVPSTSLMFHQVLVVALMLAAFTDWSAVSGMAPINWLLLLLLGVFCTAGAHTFVSVALKNLPAKTVALISCLQPVLAALFAWLILAEKPAIQVLLGGAIIVAVAAFESRTHHRSE
ncbi:DMT family transporter [Teredinibacter turnerae]|uniref:DMT family transporter n=1 Tax=Teredinibacter turnerae TaxID=2426 RepID=UPI00048BC793|nr:DMT family transporter [Teredinibacter turnerae]